MSRGRIRDMKRMLIEDMREYIFLIFSVKYEENGISMDSRTYLGTGFSFPSKVMHLQQVTLFHHLKISNLIEDLSL